MQNTLQQVCLTYYNLTSERTYVHISVDRAISWAKISIEYVLLVYLYSKVLVKLYSKSLYKNGHVFLDTQQGLIHDSYEKILLNPLIILIFWCRGGGGGVGVAGLKKSSKNNLFIQKIKNQPLHFEYCTKDS